MSTVSKISFSDAVKFFRDYETDNVYANLRVGQAFMNKFYERESDSELFYTNNYFVARNIIFSKYVEFENE